MTQRIPTPDGLSVYVHFPWCLTKCPYCDFLSVEVSTRTADKSARLKQARQSIPHERYADSVIRELSRRLQVLFRDGPRPPLSSIYFGGGTPSLWAPEQLGRVLKSIHSELAGRHPEITVECNPSSVDEAHFSQLAELGVQRVSIGVQGLHEDRLKFLGRLHDAVDGLSAIEQAQRAGIPRISADLIFGVHTQGPQAAVLEAETVADSGVAHLSVYSLTIEPGTRFHARRKQGSLPLLAESLVAESYQAVESALEARGFGHYEISNYARNGQQSLHNLGYWMGRDYLGVGTGAVGTVVTPDGRVRYKNLLVPERYIEAWSEHVEHPFSEKLSEREQITAQISIDETLMLGLRTELGVDLAEMEHRHGTRLKREQEKVISELTDSGWFEVVNSRLRLRREKWLFADHAIRALL